MCLVSIKVVVTDSCHVHYKYYELNVCGVEHYKITDYHTNLLFKCRIEFISEFLFSPGLSKILISFRIITVNLMLTQRMGRIVSVTMSESIPVTSILMMHKYLSFINKEQSFICLHLYIFLSVPKSFA